jgi:hypothetical protein
MIFFQGVLGLGVADMVSIVCIPFLPGQESWQLLDQVSRVGHAGAISS